MISVLSTGISAQSNNVTFPSSELQQMALRYAGSSLNWPILVTLADHDIPTNTFTLTSSDLLQLETLASVATTVAAQEERVKGLISRGATIFADDKLNEVNSRFNQYIIAIQEGNMEQALQLGNSIPSEVNELENLLDNNRLVLIQAQLNQKKGQVDKRLGLLASWEDAVVGDLFKESDGIRTMEESYANLMFTDGSSVMIDPSSVAVIRKSRIDKLDESADTEISLVEGGLLAKLSAAGKARSRYVLNAGNSQSELRSQNFYAESDGASTVKLTNYDGNVDVSANNVTITIQKNEGTIVREGQAPSAPIQLLPAPVLAWAKQDSIIYRNSVVFPFEEVTDAENYLIQYSSSPTFDRDINEISTPSNSVSLENLPLGRTYVRVLAIDDLGLRGPYSEVTRITRNEDNKPPAVFVYGLDRPINFTLSSSIQIIGFTEPDASLTINNEKIDIQASGRFVHTVRDLEEDQTVAILSTDGSGNSTEKPIRIVRLTEDTLFAFSLSGARRSGDKIISNQRSVTFSGAAYPGLEVTFNNGENERKLQTDSRGRWGITMTMQEGELSVTFRDIRSGSSYLTKSFTVEAN